MAILKVSNQAQLEAAVLSVRDGDTILLSTGVYNKLEMVANRAAYSHTKFKEKVTIASADPNKPAIINEVLLRGATNVEIKGVTLDYNPSKSGSSPFWVEAARGITFNDVRFDGHLSNGYGSGIGLRVKTSQNITVKDSEIVNFKNGMNLQTSQDLVISGNKFLGMSLDGMLSGAINGMLIEGNYFSKYKSPNPEAAHKDNIQFTLASAATASQNIVIRDNIIDSAEVRHGIFFGNEAYKKGDKGAFYKNISIENNYLKNAHILGITIQNGDGVTIKNNTLVPNPDLGYTENRYKPEINIWFDSKNVKIEGNKTSGSTPSFDGASKSSFTSTAAAPEPEATKTAVAAPAPTKSDETEIVQGSNQIFRINGRQVDGETQFRIDDVDFAAGDTIVLNKFETGTFFHKPGNNGLNVWDANRAVRLDSDVDFQELVALSPAVTAVTTEQNDRLILSIAQDSGVAEISLDGLGAAFRAADQSELF